jgi:hypothetical protein
MRVTEMKNSYSETVSWACREEERKKAKILPDFGLGAGLDSGTFQEMGGNREGVGGHQAVCKGGFW